MKKSFGTLDQLRIAVENRIDELEGSNPVEFTEDIDHSTLVEASENISVRQCKAAEQIDTVTDECDEAEDYDCVTC